MFLDHPGQDEIPLLSCSLQITPWRKIVRALQKSRQHCRLPNGKIFGRFSEISLRSRLCTVQSTPEVYPIQVELHDLVLRYRPFDSHREKDLEYLTMIRAIPQIEYIPGYLLGNRAGALPDATGPGILEQRAKYPVKVNAAVLVKPVILLRDDSIDQVGRNLVEVDLFSILNKDFAENLSIAVVNHARGFDRIQFCQIEFRSLFLIPIDKIESHPRAGTDQNQQDQNRDDKKRSTKKGTAAFRFTHSMDSAV